MPLVGEHLNRHPPLLARILMLPAAAEERHAGERAGTLLERVGLSDRARDKARHLSYGEQRRMEIARALASDPRLLLLDEPIAGMNAEEVRSVAALILRVAADGRSVLLVEHNEQLAARDGRLRSDHAP